MNQFEQRVRELAYQIWESEGQPAGHEYRHWEMALKLAEAQENAVDDNMSGHTSAFIAQEQSNPDTVSSIGSVSLQPEQSTSSMRSDISPHINKPSELVSSIEGSSHLSQEQMPQLSRPNTKKKGTKSHVKEDKLKPKKDVKADSKKSKKNRVEGRII
jgi:hypothetical protein